MGVGAKRLHVKKKLALRAKGNVAAGEGVRWTDVLGVPTQCDVPRTWLGCRGKKELVGDERRDGLATSALQAASLSKHEYWDMMADIAMHYFDSLDSLQFMRRVHETHWKFLLRTLHTFGWSLYLADAVASPVMWRCSVRSRFDGLLHAIGAFWQNKCIVLD